MSNIFAYHYFRFCDYLRMDEETKDIIHHFADTSNMVSQSDENEINNF